MGQKYVFQCQSCGFLHRLKRRCDIEDDMYVKLTCPKCRGETSHICCGTEDEKYELYNVNVDLNYY